MAWPSYKHDLKKPYTKSWWANEANAHTENRKLCSRCSKVWEQLISFIWAETSNSEGRCSFVWPEQMSPHAAVFVQLRLPRVQFEYLHTSCFTCPDNKTRQCRAVFFGLDVCLLLWLNWHICVFNNLKVLLEFKDHFGCAVIVAFI